MSLHMRLLYHLVRELRDRTALASSGVLKYHRPFVLLNGQNEVAMQDVLADLTKERDEPDRTLELTIVFCQAHCCHANWYDDCLGKEEFPLGGRQTIT
eukprot:2403090-Amphidinium_carterae.2